MKCSGRLDRDKRHNATNLMKHLNFQGALHKVKMILPGGHHEAISSSCGPEML